MPVTSEDYAAERERGRQHAAGPHAFIGGSALDGEVPGTCGWCHQDSNDPRHLTYGLGSATVDPETPVDHRPHDKRGVLLATNQDEFTYLICGCGAIFHIQFHQKETEEVTDPEIKALVLRAYKAVDRQRVLEEIFLRKLDELRNEFGHG